MPIEKKPFGVTIAAKANMEHFVAATQQCAADVGINSRLTQKNSFKLLNSTKQKLKL